MDHDYDYRNDLPDGFRWDDLAGHPEALEAALSGDWSAVGEEDLDEAA
jgi:hypothetical protein